MSRGKVANEGWSDIMLMCEKAGAPEGVYFWGDRLDGVWGVAVEIE